MTEKQEKRSKLALDVLNLSRNTLIVNLRFLDMALSRFTYHEIPSRFFHIENIEGTCGV